MLGVKQIAQVALAGGVLLLGSGCGGREKVAMANKDETIRRQEAAIERERAEKEKAARLNEDLARQNAEMAEKQSKMAAQSAAETAAMRQELADLQGLIKGMGNKFAVTRPNENVPDGKDGAFSLHGDGTIHLVVANSTLFDAGKADLKTSSHSMLRDVASKIKTKFPGNYIRVEGHTDSTPVVHNKNAFADNMALSIARSRAVYDYLIKNGGLSANKMYTAGYGEHQPLVHPEKTAADRAKNRRVEIVIMPDNVKVTKEPMAAASAAPKKKK
jgi:outer membrane protein OmpA-like peptidoglycan-associated protein